MKTVIAWILLTVVVSLAQTRSPMHFKQDQWQRHGILLTPMSDYSGTQGLNPRLTASLKPFEHAVFVLQNRTGHALHGFSAVWTWTDSSTGKARQSHLVNFLVPLRKV